MKKNNTGFFDSFRPSFIHIFGTLIIIAGIALLWYASSGVGRKKHTVSEDSGLHESDDESDDCDDIVMPYSTLRPRAGSTARLGIAIFGGLLILSGVPLFYAPYVDKGMRLRRRKRKAKEKEAVDKEFDYPDDEFDFIIVKSERDKLIEEKLANIERKKNRK